MSSIPMAELSPTTAAVWGANLALWHERSLNGPGQSYRDLIAAQLHRECSADARPAGSEIQREQAARTVFTEDPSGVEADR